MSNNNKRLLGGNTLAVRQPWFHRRRSGLPDMSQHAVKPPSRSISPSTCPYRALVEVSGEDRKGPVIFPSVNPTFSRIRNDERPRTWPISTSATMIAANELNEVLCWSDPRGINFTLFRSKSMMRDSEMCGGQSVEGRQ